MATRATGPGRRRCSPRSARSSIEVPRDRDGSFDRQTVRKRQRRLDGVDSMVISLDREGVDDR